MKNSNYKVLILCGGLGTRFRSVDDSIPKSLGVVSGKPILKWLIEDLINQGFSKIILATGHLSEKIENFVNNEFIEHCIVSKEKSELGTGGALKNAESFLSNESFLVLNGDSRIKYQFQNLFKFHFEKKADMSLLLSSVISGNDYGNIKLSKTAKIEEFQEKINSNDTSFINSGVYCINPLLLKDMTKDKYYSLEKDLLPKWINKKNIFGQVVNLPFTDIGTLERFKKASFE